MATIDEAGLRADINKWLRSFAERYCKEAEKRITAKAVLAINQYYMSYEPTSYIRTNNLWSNSYKAYYKDNGSVIYGGVRISPSFMSPYNKKSTDVSMVVESGWDTGYHTPEKSTVPAGSIVREFMDDSGFLSSITELARNTAMSQSYRYIQF